MTHHESQIRWILKTAILALTLLAIGLDAKASEPSAAVKHPNLLLNREEIDQIKAKIKQHDWAARVFEQVKAMANDGSRTGRNPREAALAYVLTGEKRYGNAVRGTLVSHARHMLTQYEKLDLKVNPDFGAWGALPAIAWAYDLTYDVFSADERQVVERYLRTAALSLIEGLKVRSTSPDLVFGKHVDVGLIGFCLGDKELIEWGLNDPGHHGPVYGGFYQVLDSNMRDRYFWSEAPRYALGHTLQGALALAEAALHYDGTDLYHYVSKKSGGSIKGLLDGYLRLLYPLEKTGIDGGSLRMITYGDASTAISPKGEHLDTFLINPVAGGPKSPRTMNGELELAYKRYKDPGYAWLLQLNPRRDAYSDNLAVGSGQIWGHVALTHGEPLPEKPEPPSAPGGVYPGQGLAVLRAQESPGYWNSGATTAVLRLGAAVGHGHNDYFHLILHGKGRLLYPDLQLITYEPTYLNWTREGIAHNTLLVDHKSPKPGPFTTRQDFTPEAKFFAVTGSAFENVTQTRAVVLTPDYLADVFHAADQQGQERNLDWVLHGLGKLYPGNPAAYRPTDALLAHYWWVDNERGRTTDGAWQMDWVQKSGGALQGIQALGKEWFEQTAGIRMTMLGVKGTEVYHGDGPITDGPPYHRIEGNPEGSVPMVVVRRKTSATTFTAIHEPYEKRSSLRRIRKIQETASAVGIALEGEQFSDRIMMAYTADKEQTLRSTDGESFSFRDYGYLRITANSVIVRGQVSSFRMRTAQANTRSVMINGTEQAVKRDGEFLSFGNPPTGEAPAPIPGTANPVEQRASVHYSFLPEEVHLSAGSVKEAAFHLRCVGEGETRGQLRLLPPKGVAVEPGTVDVAGMKEGDAKVVRLRFQAAADAANGLYSVRIEPDRETQAAPGTLLVSVGVVITEDKRLPLQAQSVIRAPGYTMKLDHLGGVSYYLLDGDGHRRHGHVHDSSSRYGFGAIEREGGWAFRYRQACRFVFEGKNSLILVSGDEGPQVRVRYTFHEDRIVLGLVPPTHPTQEFTMWLGNFDALGQPRFQGITQKRGKGTALIADWFYFPHPIHRQGMLLLMPQKAPLLHAGTAVNFAVKTGQEITLRFATADELPGLVNEGKK